MKNIFKLSVALLLCLISVSFSIFAAEEISVTLDGNKIEFADQAPTIIEGRTLVPLRAIFEALGASVEWDAATRTVNSVKGDINVSLTVGTPSLYVNGAVKTLDVPAQIINGRTMVPARAVAEAFGVDVKWDAAARTVVLHILEGLTPQEIISERYSAAVFSVYYEDKEGNKVQNGNGVFIDNEGTGIIALSSLSNVGKTMIILADRTEAEIQGVLDFDTERNWAVIKTDFKSSDFVDINNIGDVKIHDEVYSLFLDGDFSTKVTLSKVVETKHTNLIDANVGRISSTGFTSEFAGAPVFSSSGAFLGIDAIEYKASKKTHYDSLVYADDIAVFRNDYLHKPEHLAFDDEKKCIGTTYYDLLYRLVIDNGENPFDNFRRLKIKSIPKGDGIDAAIFLVVDKRILKVVYEEYDANSYLVYFECELTKDMKYADISYFFGTPSGRGISEEYRINNLGNSYYFKKLCGSHVKCSEFSKDYIFALRRGARVYDMSAPLHDEILDDVERADLQNELSKNFFILLENFDAFLTENYNFGIEAFDFNPDLFE